MLVLSRRLNDSVVFPNLGIKVQVLRLSNKYVRIGIEPPPEIQVLRDELAPRQTSVPPSGAAQRATSPRLDEVAPALREHVHSAAAALARVQQLIESGRHDETEPGLFRIFHELQCLDESLAPRCDSESPRFASALQRALLVDDNANETRLLASYLRLKNFEVDTAANGADALHYLSRHQTPDVVLLDMNMPKFDGRWTIREIRSNRRYDQLKVIAVSGIHPSEYGVALGPGGCDSWFRKPLNPQTLVDAIAKGTSPNMATVV